MRTIEYGMNRTLSNLLFVVWIIAILIVAGIGFELHPIYPMPSMIILSICILITSIYLSLNSKRLRTKPLKIKRFYQSVGYVQILYGMTIPFIFVYSDFKKTADLYLDAIVLTICLFIIGISFVWNCRNK